MPWPALAPPWPPALPVASEASSPGGELATPTDDDAGESLPGGEWRARFEGGGFGDGDICVPIIVSWASGSAQLGEVPRWSLRVGCAAR